MNRRGIDVSKWQGLINFEKVKKAGIEFVILRDGYGKESPTQVDKRFKYNYSEAKAVGLNVGVYHYSYASSVDDAKAEAEFCLNNISGKQFEYPICFDIEDSEMLVLSNRKRTDIVKAFCDEIEKAGYYAMLYCSLNWLRNYLFKDELLCKYDLWLAQWSGSRPAEDCGIWQFSESGTVSGIHGNVDLDYSYKDYPEIMKRNGLNGFIKVKTSTETSFKYTVKSGDTLTLIAKKYKTTVDRIASINGITDKNKIFIGQVLKI